MANEISSLEPAAKPRSMKRFQIGLNVITQVFIVFVLVAMINFIGFRQFKRWDLSQNKKYELSSMTTNLLASLQKPVKATVFFNPGVAIANDVSLLLREFEYASKKKFEVEVVDPYNNVSRAKDLASKYKFGGNDNIVILDYDGHIKFVTAQDMAELEQLDQMAQMQGQQPRIKAFKGEQAITSALIEITEEKQNKVYVLAGHGEPELKGGTLNGLKAATDRQNIKLETLKLNDVDKVPEDANGLMIIGARADFSERELKLVTDFWAKKGRLFVLLDPDGRTPRLDGFLLENGITPSHDRVLRVGKGLGRDDTQSLALHDVVYLSPTGVMTERGKDISKDLAGIDTALLGATESLQLNIQKAQLENRQLTPLIESSKEFWGETEFVGDQAVPFLDTKKDHVGPLTLAAAMEKGAVADARVKVDTSRMIVVGNAGWIADEGIRVAEVGINFAMNSLNWLLNREPLIGIPPKVKAPVHLGLDDEQLFRLAVVVTLLIPSFFAVIGVGVWFVRRS
ncbi:MAG: hypothetical protein JWL90_1291 [Chthoniobacteraceae bacterium]|nr:hypothetical protein [Chthoniobacteraceae bacterium]